MLKKYKVEKLIGSAIKAHKNATTNWSKDFWFSVFAELCSKYNRNDLYKKNIH